MNLSWPAFDLAFFGSLFSSVYSFPILIFGALFIVLLVLAFRGRDDELPHRRLGRGALRTPRPAVMRATTRALPRRVARGVKSRRSAAGSGAAVAPPASSAAGRRC